MRVQRCRPGDLSTQRVDIAVVIDVLRMTSTAAALMRRASCPGMAVAATLDDLDRLPQPASERVIVSELAAAARLGMRVDNSPAQVSRMSFGQRTPVLVTTNGTRALLAAAGCARRVLLASFVDLHAVARHIVAMAAATVVLLPAGHFASGEGRIEDDLCADALASLLAGQEPDLVASAAAVRAHPQVRRRVASEAGFGADLDLALRADPSAPVLEFLALDAGIGRIVRAC